MTGVPDPETLKTFNNNVADEFRANDGKVGGRFAGHNLLLLTTTGAKSGQPRLSPLAYLTVDDKPLILAGYGGADVNPAWVHNLRANPAAHIEIGTESFDAVARELSPAERGDIRPPARAVPLDDGCSEGLRSPASIDVAGGDLSPSLAGGWRRAGDAVDGWQPDCEQAFSPCLGRDQAWVVAAGRPCKGSARRPR